MLVQVPFVLDMLPTLRASTRIIQVRHKNSVTFDVVVEVILSSENSKAHFTTEDFVQSLEGLLFRVLFANLQTWKTRDHTAAVVHRQGIYFPLRMRGVEPDTAASTLLPTLMLHELLFGGEDPLALGLGLDPLLLFLRPLRFLIRID